MLIPRTGAGNRMSTPSITIDCPHCGETLTVVDPERDSQNQPSADKDSVMESISPLDAEVHSWEEVTPTDPYTGAESPRPTVSQKIKADVQINGETIPVTVFYAPHTSEWEYWKYVVRAKTNAGRKSKDVFDSSDGLYLKNRGIPWVEDKDWTYLSKEACERRTRIADLGNVISDPELDYDNRFRLLLDEDEQPLIDSEGHLAERLVEKLTKGLLVLQSANNPAT